MEGATRAVFEGFLKTRGLRMTRPRETVLVVTDPPLAAIGHRIWQAAADVAAEAVLVTITPRPTHGSEPPEAVGDLMPPGSAYTLEQLLESAAERPQMRALDLRENAARSRLDVERASVYPDITLGIGAGREGPSSARENLVVFTVSVPLPLFRRNATGIGKATAELTQAQIDRQAASRDVPALVRSLWAKVESLRQRVKRLEASAVARLDENQRLSTKAYSAGEIGRLQLLTVNRQLVDGRRDVLEARSELRQATIAL